MIDQAEGCFWPEAAGQVINWRQAAADSYRTVASTELSYTFMSKEDKLRAKALGTSEMEKRLANFRQQTYADLLALPDHKTDDLNSGKYTVQVTTYRTDLQDDGLQIVVQWYFHIRLGYGWIGADGFMISNEDEIRDLEEKELYDFT